tara:strand:+ start:7371 stop:8552 length:1182 start_codon:yes stop_codon:yes gene_type:complete
MHILESYALQDNLKIDRPFIYEKYFPMAIEGKYITLDISADSSSAKYDNWSMVVDFISPMLKQMGVTLVLLGDKDDTPIPGCYIALGQTDFNQKAYVIRDSALHITCNNLSLQIASHYNKNIVSLFSNCFYDQFKPYWSNKDEVGVFKGNVKKPSFNPDENPKTINNIKPEKIGESILSFLGRPHSFAFSTLRVGPLYQNRRIESSLSNPIQDIKALGVESLIVHLDYNFNLDNLIKQLEICSCSVITDKPIPQDIILKYKNRIVELVYYLDDNHDVSFVSYCIQNGINIGLVSKQEKEKVDSYKINFLDIDKPINIIPRIKFEDIEEIKNINKKKIFFKSNKFLIHNGKAYASKMSVAVDQPVSSFDHPFMQIIDHDDFWEEKDHFYFVEKK